MNAVYACARIKVVLYEKPSLWFMFSGSIVKVQERDAMETQLVVVL